MNENLRGDEPTLAHCITVYVLAADTVVKGKGKGFPNKNDCNR